MPLSLLQIHTNAWKNCQRCPLAEDRKNVCICRGQVPADVLFIGEAPGESEDVFGLPFVGPAGKLLDAIIAKAEKDAISQIKFMPPDYKITKAWTNLVGCIPKTHDGARKKVEPLPSEIDACEPRLNGFITICKPKLIVAVGEMAKEYGREQRWYNKVPAVIEIVHPAYILRRERVQRPLLIQRTEIALRDGFYDTILCEIPF